MYTLWTKKRCLLYRKPLKPYQLEYAALAESYSNHPIAQSFLAAYGKEVNKEEIGQYDEIAGHGIKIEVNGKTILAGNKKLMKKESFPLRKRMSLEQWYILQ